MTTNPLWTPNVPPDDWYMFGPEAQARQILGLARGSGFWAGDDWVLTRPAAPGPGPNAILTIDAEVAAIYSPPPENPDNIQPWSMSGTTPELDPVLELASDLYDRMLKPEDGIDQYPLVTPVELYYKSAEHGLAWRHKKASGNVPQGHR